MLCHVILFLSRGLEGVAFGGHCCTVEEKWDTSPWHLKVCTAAKKSGKLMEYRSHSRICDLDKVK